MNKRLQELAARKQMLQARASLHRLELQRDWLGLGDSLHWLRAGASAASSLSAGTAALGGALKKVLVNPFAGLFAASSGLLLLVRLVGLGVRALRGPAEPPSN